MKTLYQPLVYQNLTLEEIKKTIQRDRFDPILFTNAPGDRYSPHSHKETKLLVFIKGTMSVLVADKTFECKKGDKLIIPGDIVHSAIVGREGCTFFWSQKYL